MTERTRRTGDWTPRRQAMAYDHVLESIQRSRQTARELIELGQRSRDKALRAAADALLSGGDEVQAANEADLASARQAGMNEGGLTRLRLTQQRLAELTEELHRVAELPSPLTDGVPDQTYQARVPLGVIGVIYEPQPATTVLAGAPILKAGNAVLLRGSPGAARTDAALVAVLRSGLTAAGVPTDAVQALSATDRATIRYLVGARGLVDLVVLRAGASLSRFVHADAKVPLAELGHGVCHVYLDADADPARAEHVVLSSTLTHPDRTGAAHTVLVHQRASERLLPRLVTALRRAGVAVCGDPRVVALADGVRPANDNDWRDEYPTLDLAARVVRSLDDAIDHIDQYGTGHTEVIVTEDRSTARAFAARVDAAAIRINTATEPDELFTTQKTHIRGCLAPAAFTTTKHVTWPE